MLFKTTLFWCKLHFKWNFRDWGCYCCMSAFINLLNFTLCVAEKSKIRTEIYWSVMWMNNFYSWVNVPNNFSTWTAAAMFIRKDFIMSIYTIKSYYNMRFYLLLFNDVHIQADLPISRISSKRCSNWKWQKCTRKLK